MALSSSSLVSLHDNAFLFTSEVTVQLPESDSRRPTSALVHGDLEMPAAPSVQTFTILVPPTFHRLSPPAVLLPPTLQLGSCPLVNRDKEHSGSQSAKVSVVVCFAFDVQRFLRLAHFPIPPCSERTLILIKHGSQEGVSLTHHRTQSGSKAAVNVTSMRERATHSASAQGHRNDNELLTTSPPLSGNSAAIPRDSATKPSQSKQLPRNKSQASHICVRDEPQLRRIEEGNGSLSSTDRKSNTIHLPSHSRQHLPSTGRTPGAMVSRITGATKAIDVSRRDDWRHWLELGVFFGGFPPSVTTRDVWKAFKEEGDIVTIELFDNDMGELNGRGRVRFRYSFCQVDGLMLVM